MQYPIVRSIALAAAVLLPVLDHADSYLVQFTTTVAQADASSGLNTVMPVGSTAVVSFTVDSANYSDSGRSPIRGYVVDPSSFSLVANGTNVAVTLADPTYFSLRNNVTNVIAAVLMFYFGSGPIRGFAVVLMIGIVTSVFTAVNVTRMFVALWVRKARPKELHI